MKFETSQTSEPTSANMSIVSRSTKRGPTMLRSFAQHIQQYCAGVRALHATYPHKYMRTRNNQSATVVTRGYAMYRNSLKLAWMFLYAGFYCSKNNTTIRSPNSRTFVTLELWSTCRSRHPYIFSKSKR